VKRSIAALAVALIAFPATASAVSNPRESDQIQSSSLGVSPHVAAGHPTANDVPRYLPAGGTDVAAFDQQASAPGAPAPVSVAASDSSGDFDWADAGIGAATAVSLVGISLAGGMVLRRRQDRRPSAIAG
jgi:hypothetical protein